jgi:hypothetical protein
MATGLPGVAAADPADAFDRASNCSIFPDGIGKVTTAGRLEAAVPAQKRTQEQTIGGNQPEESQDRQPIGGRSQSSRQLQQTVSHSSRRSFSLTIAG